MQSEICSSSKVSFNLKSFRRSSIRVSRYHSLLLEICSSLLQVFVVLQSEYQGITLSSSGSALRWSKSSSLLNNSADEVFVGSHHARMSKSRPQVARRFSSNKTSRSVVVQPVRRSNLRSTLSSKYISFFVANFQILFSFFF
ncbi:hypothetical protein BVRB_4g083100 [Beta vulgaris subsp. vulgaris]|nr:hypothetical protein BVRB_4g083100 [Beta vulgaris subsp. vulgaris]